MGKNNFLHDKLMSLKLFLNNPSSIFSVISFILGFYLIIYFLDIPMTNETKPFSVFLIDMFAWTLFIIMIICDFFGVFFNINIVDSILSWELLDSLHKFQYSDVNDTSSNNLKDSSNNVKDTSNNVNHQGSELNEVFNISNNLYSYDDAPAVCSVYGAKLATYEQVEAEYNNGGEWCNYGWSEGQLALFPTQKNTWDKLQKSKDSKNQCGRPGVNGGYMENPNMMFGVNCYGKKPVATHKDITSMDTNREVVVPKSVEDLKVDAKINMWKNNPDQFLVVNSFNRDHWSKY
jgi:hypothetical protein